MFCIFLSETNRLPLHFFFPFLITVGKYLLWPPLVSTPIKVRKWNLAILLNSSAKNYFFFHLKIHITYHQENQFDFTLQILKGESCDSVRNSKTNWGMTSKETDRTSQYKSRKIKYFFIHTVPQCYPYYI